jgi:tetratricopeptide (TPR) repeat protein
MNLNLLPRLSWLMIALILGVAGVAAAEEPNGGEDVVGRFLEHVDGLSIADETKQQIRQLVEELRADEYTRNEAITTGLGRIFPEYETALSATWADDPSDAIGQLTAFATSDDRFLAADASFFLARTLINGQRFEEALPLLEKLCDPLADYSLHAGSALYFRGVAEASLLENQRAIKSFSRFLADHEDAPERLRVAAWRQIQTISAIEEGAMDDVLQRMDYSRRRLEIKNTDKDTQFQQDKIVGMLAKLIREQEKKECSSCSSSKNCEDQQQEAQGKAQGQNDGEGKSTAGGTSNNPNGVVRRTYDDGPASPWSQLRNRTRDAANNAVKEKLPPRYRTVVEKYYGKTSGNDDGK